MLWRRLEYDFLACFCALRPTFRLSFFFSFFSYFFPASRYVFLRVHSSVQRPATVKALVRWATGKRLTNCLPKLSLISPNRVPKLSLIVKALVRWATGKRLTNRLPKLSLTTLSPPLNSGILGLRMGPYVPTPKFFTISGDPGRVIYQILGLTFYQKPNGLMP